VNRDGYLLHAVLMYQDVNLSHARRSPY